MNFVTYDRKAVDLIQHCLEQRVKRDNLTIFIGTDSISIAGIIHYYIVVAFRYDKNGAHFIFAKEKVPTYRQANGKPDVFTKLWRECQLTIEVAEVLVNKDIFRRDEIIIELDYNSVVDTLSKPLIPATKGWAVGLGYQVLTKYGEYAIVNGQRVDDQVAVKAANHLCKGV